MFKREYFWSIEVKNRKGVTEGYRSGVWMRRNASEVVLEIRNKFETDSRSPVIIALNRV